MSVKKPVSDLKDSNYLSVKATLKRYVFRTDLKFSRGDLDTSYLFKYLDIYFFIHQLLL